MALTAPGASEPVVRADNMRLDVALMPLLFHQLQVKQVMLKGAVIQLTAKTEAVRNQNAPVVPHDNTLPQAPLKDRGWSYDVRKLQVADSVLFFQHENGEQVTVRDIRYRWSRMTTIWRRLNFSRQGSIADQRDLTLSFTAQVQGGDYPHSLKADFSQLNWQVRGAELPPDGLSGQGSLQASWIEEAKKLDFNNLNLTANGSAITGSGSVVLGEKPDWALNLQATTLNLDSLLAQSATANEGNVDQRGQSQPRQLRPVIADSDIQQDYHSLLGFNGQLALSADQVQWRGMRFSQVKSDITNQQGLLTVKQLEGSLGEGRLSLPGMLDVRGNTSHAAFQPQLDNVEIGTILQAFTTRLT